MGGLLGGQSGGKGKSNQADWGQIERLMELQADLNRYGQQGLFTSSDWTENPDGTWDQSTSVNPAMQGAMDTLMSRASGPQEQYSSPAQFSQMLDAKMANQMGRQNLLQPGAEPQPQTGFGTPAAEQDRGLGGAFTTPPPGAGGPPPGAGGPPPGGGGGPPPGGGGPPGGDTGNMPQQQGPSPEQIMAMQQQQQMQTMGGGGPGGGGPQQGSPEWEMMQKLAAMQGGK